MKKIAIFVALLLCLTLLVVSCKNKGEEGAATSNQETPAVTTVGGDPATDPEATDPEATDPEATDPEATDPASTDPASTDPASTEATEPTEEPIETVIPDWGTAEDDDDWKDGSPIVPF